MKRKPAVAVSCDTALPSADAKIDVQTNMFESKDSRAAALYSPLSVLFNLISIIDYIEENMPLNIATVKTESSQANYKITITLSHGSFLAVY